ncbi:MAG: sugar phosphate isomerase/epimerase [Saprospiraceae bacterium]|nr:sugar phosphate isomerase/epimerase [Saprospiraceae bacterium]
MDRINRRNLLKGISVLGGSTLLPGTTTALHSMIKDPKEEVYTSDKPFKKKFSYCFNSSTIRGQKIGIEKEVELVAKAGYDAIEVWVPVLNEYKKSGKSIKDLSKKIKDLGLNVADAIGFAQWIHEDDTIRSKALEQVKEEMDMLAEMGCHRIAAPPSGATNEPAASYDAVAERFHTLIEIGVQHAVIPQLELWGFSKTLYNMSQLMYVAAQCGHPQTRLLTDVYHLYKGGSNLDALKLVGPESIEIFHMNDYKASSDRATITDADRIYPGEGATPMSKILRDLALHRDHIILSLELFNPEYYKLDAAPVINTGLAKLKATVTNAMG